MAEDKIVGEQGVLNKMVTSDMEKLSFSINEKGIKGLDLFKNKSFQVSWEAIEKITVDKEKITIKSRPLGDIKKIVVNKVLMGYDEKGFPIYKKKYNTESKFTEAELSYELKYTSPILVNDENKNKSFEVDIPTPEDTTVDSIRSWRDIQVSLQNYMWNSGVVGKLPSEDGFPGISVYALPIPSIEFTTKALDILKVHEPEYFTSKKGVLRTDVAASIDNIIPYLDLVNKEAFKGLPKEEIKDKVEV